jgi:EAL domain-containing protein (putative c-di-GMP-specific phosphodiesterase class I)
MRTIRNGAVEPRWLEFEITERIAMLDEQETLRWLHDLREFGVGIAIDDFGTGYSSLSYLKRLPVDTVKIDKSFIRDIETDQEDAAIIKAIISMAHSLDIEVVAEGVETERQLALLRAQECNQAQGYLVCRPLPPGELVAFMRSNAAWHLQGDAAE